MGTPSLIVIKFGETNVLFRKHLTSETNMLLNLFRRMLGRPKQIKHPSAEEVLATMTPVESIPAIDARRQFGKQVSAPCVLAQLLPDGAVLEHGEIALYDFQSGEWVAFPKADRKVRFTATHYRIAS